MLVWGFEGRSKSESGGSACCCWDRLGSSVTTRLKDAPSPPRDAIAAPLNKYRGTPPSMKTLRGRQGGRRPAFCVQRNRRVKGEWASGRAGKQMARRGRGEEGGWCKKGSRQRQYLGHKMSGNTRQRRCLTAVPHCGRSGVGQHERSVARNGGASRVLQGRAETETQ